MPERSLRAYRYCLYFCGAFTLLHAISLPVLVTWDSHLYVDLADVIGSRRFPGDWDFLRTPLYPMALKLAFWLLGRQPLAVIALGSLLGFIGTWSLGAAIKEMGYPRAAAAGLVCATLYPTLVAYEHALLTEVGTFCLLSLLVRGLVWNAERRAWHIKTLTLAGLVVAGFYFRPSLLYLAPVIGVLHAFDTLRTEERIKGAWRAIERPALVRAAIQFVVVVAVPFLLALPWNRAVSHTSREADVLFFGLIKQAAIPPGDPSLGRGAAAYERAIQEATVNGRLDVGGVHNMAQLEIWAAMPPDQQRGAAAIFKRVVREHPVRYLKGMLRTMLLFSGLPAQESDNAIFTNIVLRTPGATILPGPPHLQEPIRRQFSQTTGVSVIARFLRLIQPLYDVLIFVGFIVAASGAVIGVLRADLSLLTFGLLPLAFLAMHAVLLLSLDRYAFPVYSILIVGLAYVPIRILRRRPEKEGASVAATLEQGPSERRAFAALASLLAVLALWHAIYLSLSRTLPSWDEAHYLGGALQVARGLRSSTFSGLWQAYVTVLGFKPPLLTLPAAALDFLFGDGILTSMFSLVLIFIGLGLAAWSLFRNVLPPAYAATAAVLLCTAPMVSGLTHRFYAENLLLLVSVVYLDLLLRHGWNSAKWSALAGVALGLGVLAKQTFLLLLFLPSCYLLFDAIRSLPPERLGRGVVLLGARVGLMLITALGLAGPWYLGNWRAVLEHSRNALWAESCAYPTLSSLFANISSGPHLFVFLLALAGLVPLLRVLSSGAAARSARTAWVALLILGAASFVFVTISVNKATRFSIMWLPTLAALAAYALLAHARPGRFQLAGVATAAALSMMLAFHHSFALVPLPDVRLGDLRIIDSRHPMNVPDWFDDNHPLDRRNFRQREVADLIARDSSASLGPGARPMVRLTVDTLLVTHDLMNLLTMLRGGSVSYLWWPGTEPLGPKAPDYVIQAKGFDRFYPGRRYVDYYPHFDAEVAAGKLPYREIARVTEPEGAELVIFRHNKLHADFGSPASRGEASQKARSLAR